MISDFKYGENYENIIRYITLYGRKRHRMCSVDFESSKASEHQINIIVVDNGSKITHIDDSK